MKKLFFVHNCYPDEGASGKVVFLRHFINLGDLWEIHIVLPENLRDKKPIDYPNNFFFHYIPFRKNFWPPFREEWNILVRARLTLWEWELNKLIESIKPNVIISVLSHYLAASAAFSAKKTNLPFILFVHDRWDIFDLSKGGKLIAQKQAYARQVLKMSTKILSVSEGLIGRIYPQFIQKTLLLYPIPSGPLLQATWRSELSDSINLVHVGTINKYALNIFELVAQKLDQGDKLELVYVPMDFLLPILDKYKNILIVPFFKKSADAINYVNQKATALLIYYGLSLDENPLANDSFPSRFVEFCHAGIPIICIAPEQTEFHNFLSSKNYPLLFSSTNINTLKTKLEQLKSKDFWESCAKVTHNMAINYFNAGELQACFEKALTPGNDRHEH